MKDSKLCYSYVLSNGIKYIVYTESAYKGEMIVEEFLTPDDKPNHRLVNIETATARKHYRSYVNQGYKLLRTFEAVDACTL